MTVILGNRKRRGSDYKQYLRPGPRENPPTARRTHRRPTALPRAPRERPPPPPPVPRGCPGPVRGRRRPRRTRGHRPPPISNFELGCCHLARTARQRTSDPRYRPPRRAPRDLCPTGRSHGRRGRRQRSPGGRGLCLRACCAEPSMLQSEPCLKSLMEVFGDPDENDML